ncbi:MAG: acetate/propionate family kinase [Gammaproteobacteria bacterium]|nr:acetate/propionate family kinase [Gammaproteobacteria bacterium]
MQTGWQTINNYKIKLMRAILVINSGSSTIKFAVFSFADSKLKKEFKGVFDKILIAPTLNTEICRTGEKSSTHFTLEGSHESYYQQAIEHILSWISMHNCDIVAVGHRIVHGGQNYAASIILNEKILTELATLIPIMPLHQPFNIKGVKILQQVLPHTQQIACFDTGFHVTCNPISQTYAIQKKYRNEGIKRYGFHGLSYAFIASQLPVCMSEEEANKKFVVAHLGNGATMCAIHHKKSVATSIGMTGVGGLPMATRCDNLDPGAILYMLEHYEYSVSELREIFYKKSGLLGISELSPDMRDLLASNKPEAKFAIDIFVHNISNYAGMLAAELQGCDGFIFTGGIGENAAPIRQMVGERLGWLGAEIDPQKNSAKITAATKISSDSSKIPVWVIPTDEETIIAKDTLQLLCL